SELPETYGHRFNRERFQPERSAKLTPIEWRGHGGPWTLTHRIGRHDALTFRVLLGVNVDRSRRTSLDAALDRGTIRVRLHDTLGDSLGDARRLFVRRLRRQRYDDV